MNRKTTETKIDETTLTAKHLEILKIQKYQLGSKEEELRFIAANVDRLVEAMYERAEESKVGYANRHHLDLWRGNSIDFDMKKTGHPDSVYEIVMKEMVQKAVSENEAYLKEVA